jgi:hypothetical protein
MDDEPIGVNELINKSVKKIDEEHNGVDPDALLPDSIETIKDIGYYLTERMKTGLQSNANAIINEYSNIARYKTPLLLAYPGGDNYYEEINSYRSKMYNSDSQDGNNNDELIFMSGDPFTLEVDYKKSPTLAMGDAKILNPDFQFNELDDIRSDFHRPYIGRLYSERIYDYNLPTVLFETGVLTLNTTLFALIGQMANTRDDTADMTSYLRNPSKNSLKFMFKKMGAAIRGVINFTTGGIVSGKRFYKFEPNTRIYMRFVNEMLIEVASWMGLTSLPSDDQKELHSWDNKDKIGLTQKEAEEIEKQIENNATSSKMTGNKEQGIPASGYRGLAKTLSVLNILSGWRTKNTVSRYNESLDTEIADTPTETMEMSAMQFIPFGLSRGVQVSESFSNETMEHPLAAELKSKGQQVYNQSALGFLHKAETITQTINSLFKEDYVSAFLGAGKEVLKSFSKEGVLGEAGMIISGEGKFQLPDVWEDSKYNRTYNLNFKFRSPYGNRLCIFENTMVPIIFLICMTAPRQIGASTYTSPFYIRAFSKGLFSTEIGLVDKLDIVRSEEKNERTVEGFSKVINCSISLKDVVPNLMIGLDAGIFGVLSAKNTGFREYIAMMANIDLYDRVSIVKKYKVFVDILTNQFNPDNLMNELQYSMSQTLPFKLILKARKNFTDYKPPQTVSSIRAADVYM